MSGKPPLKFRLLAKLIGGGAPEMLSNVWKYFDGAKTYIGVAIALIGFLVGWIPEAMNAAHADPALVTKIVGTLATILGLLHKAKKAFGIPDEVK